MPSSKSAKRYEEADVHVGARVRSRRMQMGMSQTDLANKIGITFQQVQKYEKGANRISSSRLYQIAGILRVTPPYFFEDPLAKVGNQDGRINTDIFDLFCASKDGVKLMRAFVRIRDKALRHKIAKLVEDLVD